MTHRACDDKLCVDHHAGVREGEKGWGCGGGACRPNAREVKCFLVCAGLRKREVVPIGSPPGTCWHKQPWVFFFCFGERAEREHGHREIAACTPTHSSGLASTIRNVERVARDTTREGWDGGAAHPRAGDTAANRRNDVRECLSRRQDASFYGNKTLSPQSHTHTHTRATIQSTSPWGRVGRRGVYLTVV
jgi:hypothetical protein